MSTKLRSQHSHVSAEIHPAIEITIGRGGVPESSHLVDAVVQDDTGRTIAIYGDGSTQAFTRSVIKPLQVMPYILSGAYLDGPDRERCISIACASHDAEKIHLETVEAWLERLQLTPNALVCGPQRSDDRSRFDKVCNNCSGKHCGMLATCQRLGWDVATYFERDHPIQKQIRSHLEMFSKYKLEDGKWGVDGCGIPTYLMPLHAIAHAMGSYLRPGTFSSEIKEGMAIVKAAQRAEPWMMGGRASLDSEILASTDGGIFTKVGAEGNYIGIFYDQGVVVALKARDGAFRAGQAAMFKFIEKIGGLNHDILERLCALAMPPVRSVAGDTVGEIRAKFS